MKRYAVVVLVLALAEQVVWDLLDVVSLHRAPGPDAIGLFIVVVSAVFAVTHRNPRWRWLTVVVRLVMATEFLLAVADRFGILGPAGSPGTSWGDFTHFVAYTRTMTTFLPAGLAPTLAVLATVAEITLGSALLLGVRLRLAALGSAVLLGTYALCMTATLPLAQQFHYTVFVLAAGMLTLATVDRTPLTLDTLRHNRHNAPGVMAIDRSAKMSA
ncbi:MAG TPA: DoxX family membrane protein [Pseudonocardiaceae bacterium]